MKPFWVVWCADSGRGPPRFQHKTETEARDEAERLALKEPGKVFYVLQSVAHCVKTGVEWVNHYGQDLDDVL